MNVLVAVLLLHAAAAAPEPLLRPVVVTVRNASKEPVKGAHLVVEPAVPVEKALAELLAMRAGASKEDGLLDLGLVPTKEPLTLRIGAPGHRMAWLKLPAGFEAGRRDVVLASNQDVEVRVTGLTGRKGEARPEVALAWCGNQRSSSNCHPGERERRPLDDEGRARFRRMEGGFYNAELHVPGVGSTREAVEVARDGDAPVVLVEMAVAEWTFRGTTRLHDGTAVAARVTAMEFVRGSGEGTAAETRSAADGTFELKVVSKAGNKVLLKGESDEPRAVSSSLTPVALDGARTLVEDVVVELDATAVEIAVRDARSGEPLPGCLAHFDWEKTGESSYRGSERRTNADGIAREVALAGGTVRVNVTCKDHYSKDLGVIDVARDETKRVDVALEPSRDLVLLSLNESGRPVSGASVFAPNGPLLGYGASGRQSEIPLAGLTNDEGELLLKGESYGGRLVFVVASGRTLGMRQLPTPEACDRPEDCRVAVSVTVPRPSGGVLVRSESGDAIVAWDLTIRRGGLPLPWPVLTAVLTVNGLSVDGPASPLDLRVTGLLPEGVYSVTRRREKTDPQSKMEKWLDVPLGSFSVPALEHVELVDHDGAPQKP